MSQPLYQLVRTACALVAGVATATFAVIQAVTPVPHQVFSAVVAVIAGAVVISVTAWLVDQAVRHQLEAMAPTVARIIGNSLGDELEPRMQRAADRAGAKSVKLIEECITGELMQEQLDAAVGKARTYGMTVEVRRRTAAGGNVATFRPRD